MKPSSSSNVSAHDKLRWMVVSPVLLIGVASPSWAASNIGASFIGRNADDRLVRTASAGVVVQPYWNNIDSGSTFKGTSQSLLDSAGNFTTVKIIYNTSDSWSSDGGVATPNERLMKGIIKANPDPDTAPANNTDRMLFVITNVPSGSYNVFVYLMENGVDCVGVQGGNGTNCAEVDVTLGATTYYVEQEGSFPGSFIKATSTTPGSYADANYAEFDGLSPVNGTIAITAKKNVVSPQLTDGAGVAGIQLVQVSGSAYAPNTSPCQITLGPSPSTNLTVEGSQVTFVIGDSGPCKVQWRKNGVDIPGANDETLIFTAALSDNNAQIVAVVYNNVNTNVTTAATLQVDANTPPVFTQGFMKVEQWQNIGGGTGFGGITDLKTNIPGSGVTGGPPTKTYYVGGAFVPQTSPDIDSFGDRVWGWVKPDVSGDYNFFIRSDDASELYLDQNPVVGTTNALPDVQADGPICFEYTCCRAFLESGTPTTTSPIHLEAGNYYGMVILLKEGGGGDLVQVAWRLTTDTTPAGSLLPIPGPNVFTMASSAGQRASITAQPQSTTVIQGRKGSFSVAVTTTPSAGQYSLQWLSNNVVIPGAAAPTYTTPATTLANNGAVYKARALTLSGTLLSSNATLTVLADTNPPVAFAGAITRNDGLVEVGVSFDEPVDVSTLVAGNFTVLGASSTTFKLATNSYNTYQGVVLDASGLTGGNTYTVRVQGVKDPYGNVMPQTDVPFTVGPVKWAETGSPIRPGQVIPVGATGFDILNGGRQEWDVYDEITMAYVLKTNDFDVQVQVVFAEPGSKWTRVGLQARNDLNVGEPASDHTAPAGTSSASAYAQTHVNPNLDLADTGLWPAADPHQPQNPASNNLHEQNCRLTVGGASSSWQTVNAGTPSFPDVWLRLQRQGTNINGYAGTDGKNWSLQGTVSLTDQQAWMYVGPELGLETGNIWNGSGFSVWDDPFDPTYDRLVLAQYRNFVDVPSVSIARASGQTTITFVGALQRATTAGGPYTDVAGATSPYTVPAGPAAGYYRARGTLVSK